MTFLQELLSKYKELEFIGEGPLTFVYRAKRKRDNELVAVKVFKYDVDNRIFLEEAKKWRGLAHPNTAVISDYNLLPVPHLEMEYFTNSLERLMESVESLGLLDTLSIVFDIGEGLKYAHSRGVIHGNLKPSNVLFKNDIPKISDWGHFAVILTESTTTAPLSHEFFNYMAPEQINKSMFGSVDERTDIWQLGVIFYRLLTGKLPFNSDNTFELLANIPDEHYRIIPPSEINSELAEYDALFEKLLARRKENRYQSIEEFQRDLIAAVELSSHNILKRSVRITEFKRNLRNLTGMKVLLLLMSMKLQDVQRAYNYADSLISETKGELNSEMRHITSQLNLILKRGDKIPVDLMRKVEALLHNLRRQIKNATPSSNQSRFQRNINAISQKGMIPSRGAELQKSQVQSRINEVASTPSDFPKELLGIYTKIELLGKGGFARVYKAKRKPDGKIVALKIPRIDEKTSSLFIREVAAWYNLNHDNIVRLYKADILPVPYLEMEFVEGVKVNGKLVRDLDAYPKPVDEKTALKLVVGIAKGLKHAHGKGIYHLDLKPLNVLLKGDLTPKITDWGLAKISSRGALDKVKGYSLGYAAPEQLDDGAFGNPDHRTDIYQLGLIFYELLTGRPPYSGVTPYAIEMKILDKATKPRPPSYFNSALAKYDGVFEKLLAKKKEDRYQSVDEFLSALESLEKLKREKEDLTKTTLAMKRSKSREEFERLKVKSIRQTVAIAVLSAKLNDKALLLEALDDLRFHTRENFEDLANLIAQVEMLTREGIPISSSLAEKIEVLVRRIEGEALR